MAGDTEWRFGPFRVEEGNERLWRGTEPIRLRPKSFAVLCSLLARAGRLVTKAELLQTVWPEVVVSEAMLTICISELRRALGETRQASAYIETVPRRGYRFMAPVTLVGLAAPTVAPAASPSARSPRPLLVGREAALAQLRDWWARAQQGERQVVFVTGEPGIGKTTLVDAWCADRATEAPLWVARGQCLDQHGVGEAYLPGLEALGQLCRGAAGAPLVAWLAQHAPSWLMQMPALLSTADLEALHRRALGATQERMLRELADAVDAMTCDQPLVLVLEDLHWSDTATLDLVSYLARQRSPARLLLLGTYRPAAVVAQGHALRAVAHDLVLHGYGAELALKLFTEAEVAQYLAARFTGHEVPVRLARLLHWRTDGNPLFLVTMVEHLVRQGWVATRAHRVTVPVGLEALEAVVPDSLRQLIEQQLVQCSPAEQRILETAGVAGVEWTVAAVAAGLSGKMIEVEEQCAALARRGQFVHPSGIEEWPDQTVTGRYRFQHALYQQVLYDRVPIGRRIHLHRQIGAREEAGYGDRAGEHAAALAVHFARGRDSARAVRYMQQAADTALGRHAYREALAQITDALDLR